MLYSTQDPINFLTISLLYLQPLPNISGDKLQWGSSSLYLVTTTITISSVSVSFRTHSLVSYLAIRIYLQDCHTIHLICHFTPLHHSSCADMHDSRLAALIFSINVPFLSPLHQHLKPWLVSSLNSGPWTVSSSHSHKFCI